MKKQHLSLNKPPGYQFSETLWFLDRRLDDCMHRVEGEAVRKLLEINGKTILIEVTENEKDLVVEVLRGTIKDPQPVLDYVCEWFDLTRDLGPFYKLLKKDQDLDVMVKKYKGFKIVGIPDLYECLCWCVMGQQINLDFAYKVKRRFVEKYGNKIIYKGKPYFLFPKPERIKDLDVDSLKALQLTGKKAEYIIGISKLFSSGELSKEKLLALKDEDKIRAKLVKIRGIGEWTANYTLMKCLRAMNSVPYGDSGINNALLNFKGIGKKNNRPQVESVFATFEGWKTYLVFYLWRSLREEKAQKIGKGI